MKAAGALALFLTVQQAADRVHDPVRAEDCRTAHDVAVELEQRYRIQGLAAYLDAVAWTEARCTASAVGDGGASLGLYQMQPRWVLQASRAPAHLQPADLHDPVLATVVATDHAVRAVRSARRSGHRGDWIAVRRWWRQPILVHDDHERHADSIKVRIRFLSALRICGHDLAVARRRPDVSAYPDGGIVAVLHDLGHRSNDT